MKKKLPAWIILMVIAGTAGLLLSITNAVTLPIIEQRAMAAANVDRYAVYPDADGFQPLELKENASVDNCYEAVQGGTVIGHVAQITVNGYKGPIEIMVGLDNSSVITGIKVGGASFAETAGLGARVKEDAFTSQFVGASAPVSLGQNIDGISGATISSGAVASGVNKAVKYIDNLSKSAADTDVYNNILSGTYEEIAHDATVERAYKTESGYVVYVTQYGFHGDIHVVVALDAQGTVTKVAIDENNFQETAGLGERVLESAFLDQFIGKTGVIGVAPVSKEWSDGTSGATAQQDWSSADEMPDAASAATSEAKSADAASSATEALPVAAVTDAVSAATTEASDSVSGATEESDDHDKDHDDKDDEDDEEDDEDEGDDHEDAKKSVDAAASATQASDAASGATAAVAASADAASSATTVVEVIEGADTMIDSVSGATISSTAVAKAVNAAIAFVRGLLG